MLDLEDHFNTEDRRAEPNKSRQRAQTTLDLVTEAAQQFSDRVVL